MITLLIAEDEPVETKYLQKVIKEKYDGIIQIIGIAIDGEETVQKALTLKPDILLLDIQMPYINGLAAGRQIRDGLIDTEIVILTAYSDFEYAKKAIQLKVEDYLVKPYSNNSFYKTLDQVIEKVNSKRNNQMVLVEKNRQINRLKVLAEKELIISIIYNQKIVTNEIKTLINILGIRSGKFCCHIFYIPNNQSFNNDILRVIKNKYKFYNDIVFGLQLMNEIIIFSFSKTLDKEIKNNSEEDIIKYLHSRGYSECIVGNSKVYEDLTCIKNAYIEAKDTLKKNDISQGANTISKYITSYTKDICQRLVREEYTCCFQIVQEFLEILSNKFHIKNFTLYKDYCKHMSICIHQYIMDFFEDSIKLVGINEVCSNIQNARNHELLKNCIYQYLQSIMAEISSYYKTTGHKTVEKIKEYLLKYYNQNISLGDIAETFELSTYYISKTFKKYEGINFKDYLISIRIEKAKELLRKSNLNINQIAYEVGYTDSNYFSKAFKKIVGITPKKYMNI